MLSYTQIILISTIIVVLILNNISNKIEKSKEKTIKITKIINNKIMIGKKKYDIKKINKELNINDTIKYYHEKNGNIYFKKKCYLITFKQVIILISIIILKDLTINIIRLFYEIIKIILLKLIR